MKKFDDYEFQIEWIENIESITEDDKKKLYELRTLNKRRKTHQNWIKKNQKVYDEYKRREKLIKELEKEEKNVSVMDEYRDKAVSPGDFLSE